MKEFETFCRTMFATEEVCAYDLCLRTGRDPGEREAVREDSESLCGERVTRRARGRASQGGESRLFSSPLFFSLLLPPLSNTLSSEQ